MLLMKKITQIKMTNFDVWYIGRRSHFRRLQSRQSGQRDRGDEPEGERRQVPRRQIHKIGSKFDATNRRQSNSNKIP
jgi:hypothetical protein